MPSSRNFKWRRLAATPILQSDKSYNNTNKYFTRKFRKIYCIDIEICGERNALDFGTTLTPSFYTSTVQ